MIGWDDDEDEDDADSRLQSSTHVQNAQPDSIDLVEEATHIKNPFIYSYLKIIRSARDIICVQWNECTWEEKSLNINALANDDEVKSPSSPPPYEMKINIFLTKGCAKDIISFMRCNILVRKGGGCVGAGPIVAQVCYELSIT